MFKAKYHAWYEFTMTKHIEIIEDNGAIKCTDFLDVISHINKLGAIACDLSLIKQIGNHEGALTIEHRGLSDSEKNIITSIWVAVDGSPVEYLPE